MLGKWIGEGVRPEDAVMSVTDDGSMGRGMTVDAGPIAWAGG